jgi:hypothetical protein
MNISTRSKLLLAGATLGPISLLVIWAASFVALHEMQTKHLDPGQTVDFQMKTFPWLPHVLPITIVGFLLFPVALASLIFDNRGKDKAI